MYQTLRNDIFTEDDIVINYCIEKEVPLHDHEFIEIAYIAEGTGTQIIGDRKINVSPTDYFIIDRNTRHQFSADDHLNIYNCIFTPRFLDPALIEVNNFAHLAEHYLFSDLFIQNGVLPPGYAFHADQQIKDLFQEMLQEYTSKQPGYLRLLQADVLKLIILSLRQIAVTPLEPSDFMDEPYRKTIQYIHYNYSKQIYLETLAKIACVSKEHFSRQFKRYTGKTVTEFIQSVRMNEAARLLLKTNLRIEEIADQVGYHDAKHFAKLFCRFKGVSPAIYRKGNRNSYI